MVPQNENRDTAVSVKETIIRKLDDLSEARLRELLTFIKYLHWKQTYTGNESPFRSVIGTLPGAALSNEAIDLELYGPVTIPEESGES